MSVATPCLVSSLRAERRFAAVIAASVIQVGLLLALGASHVERVRKPGGETFMDLLPIAPAAPRKPLVPAPAARPRLAPRRASVPRPSLPPPPAPLDAPNPDAAVPEAPPATPQVPLDLGTATLRRAIVEAARASGSVAAQAGGTTRLPAAQQRAQAIAQAKIDDCLAPEGQSKPSKSRVHLGGLPRLPGLLYDSVTGQCSLK